MSTREPRFPCAGCGRKTPASKLHPVMHGTFASGQWHVDKRCESCGGGPRRVDYATLTAKMLAELDVLGVAEP